MTRARDLADSADKDISGTVVLDDITLSNDISIADNGKALFGNSSDLQIYHSSTESVIADVGTGNLSINGTSINLNNNDLGGRYAEFVSNGPVNLFHAGIKKLATTSTGVDITGNAAFADNGKAIFGAGSDLQIYHDGDNSYIKEAGQGALVLQGTHMYLKSTAGEYYLKNTADGSVEVYHNGSPKLATTSTGVDVTGKTTSDAVDLTAIAKDISDTARDVFVYDTSKDSDGGAWRKRTQHTSWYNETLNTATRGSRKEFPAVAVIVAESDTVTIYDGDDPDMSMWMVFNKTNAGTGYFSNPDSSAVISTTTSLNGTLAVGYSFEYAFAGLVLISFLSDSATKYNQSSQLGVLNLTISERNNTGASPSVIKAVSPLVNYVINDVAMTVLPNAPIDAATGLPVPTIAVATGGGVSVIKDDGTVVDYSANSSFEVITVGFTEKGDIFGSQWYANSVDEKGYIFPLLSSDGSMDGDRKELFAYTTTSGDNMFWGGRSGGSNTRVSYGNTNVFGDEVVAGQRFTVQQLVRKKQYENLLNYTSSTYNTGWMNGEIKLATLSDTDDTDVTGTELVTNGTFDSDISGWTHVPHGTGAISWSAGTLSLDAVDTSNRAKAWTSISTEVGRQYTLVFTTTASTSHFNIGTTAGGYQVQANSNISAGTYSKTFTAISTTTYLYHETWVSGGALDNVSVRLAEEDRSVNGNGLQVFGTVTKNPVATGADLVGYNMNSSNTNHLKSTAVSDMQFGYDDFSISTWVYEDVSADHGVIYLGGESLVVAPANGIHIWVNGGFVKVAIGSGAYAQHGAVPYNAWSKIDVVRRNGIVSVYVDAKLAGTYDRSSANVTPSAMYVGRSAYNNTSTGNYLALFRISATAPTPEQIAKIYNDEKVLFQENAQATLYGSSDAVTALAYDDTTELLHVGTSAGRSVFQGLRRVENTTDAVGAAISASNGLVVEE